MRGCGVCVRCGIGSRGWCLLLIAGLLLSACGFRPRGSVTELTEPGSIFVDASRDLSIREALGVAFRDRAFELADNRDEADILLRVTAENEDERIVSVQENGRISELELIHSVNMLIARSESGEPAAYDPAQSPNRVEVNREYTYDERGVLGKENEARILREEMQVELVRQVVLRTIASLAPSLSEVDSTIDLGSEPGTGPAVDTETGRQTQ